MSTAAYSHRQTAGSAEPHTGDDIRNAEAAEDHRRMPVNRAIPDLPIRVVARISRFDDVPAKGRPINLHRFGADAHPWSVSVTPKVSKHAVGTIVHTRKNLSGFQPERGKIRRWTRSPRQPRFTLRCQVFLGHANGQ